MEASMAYVAHPSNFHDAQPYRAPVVAAAQPAPLPRRSFWRRLVNAIIDARQRDAEAAVAQYVARRGKLTDNMEREIAERFFRGSWGHQ
jgi:hypothetical protein